MKDISELLLDHGPVEKWGTLEGRITYQASCHLQNVMQVREQPRQLLRQIKGGVYVELFEADRCCGSAGIYNLTQPKTSARILDEKMKQVIATKADILVTSKSRMFVTDAGRYPEGRGVWQNENRSSG